GEPAHLRAHRDVISALEAEPLRVEGERRIEIGAVHRRVCDGKCHVSDPTRGRPGTLLRSCMARRSTPAAGGRDIPPTPAGLGYPPRPRPGPRDAGRARGEPGVVTRLVGRWRLA